MAFQEIIGHHTVVELLKRALANQRVSHAYLFVGPKGVGKETTAVHFARALNCLDLVDDACGECRSCRKYLSGNHPDFKMIRPVENSISIEQIRELQKDIVYKPYESRWKIYIIDDADLMTLEAANSLLKTLEEPPHYAVIIMISARKESILPTILSRCQLMQFHKLSRDEVKSFLLSRPELVNGEMDVDEAVLLADGSIGQALRLYSDGQIWDQRRRVLEFLLRLSEKSNLEIYELIQSLEMDKDVQRWDALLMIIKTFYRDLLILQSLPGKEHIINQRYFQAMQSMGYSVDELEKVIKLIERTNNVIMSNVDRELALEVMMYKIKARRM